MRRTASVVLTVILLFGVLPACTPQETEPGILLPSSSPSPSPTIYIPSGPATANIFGIPFSSTGSLHPILQNSKLNAAFVPLLYESLFEVNERFEAVPLLCDTWTRYGNTYEIHIRTEARFSDGTPLTPEDVRTSLELARSADSIYAGRFKKVTSIAVMPGNIVRIDCAVPIGRLELLLDIPIMRASAEPEQIPLGTGPYVYIEKEDTHYLKTYSGWWSRKTAPLTRINLIDSPEADLLINSFETGEISMAFADPTATDPVVFGGNYEEWTYPTSQLYYLGLNTQSGPCAQRDIRRMITFAVDRTFISEMEMMRYADPAVLPVHPDSVLYDSELASENSFSINMFAERFEKAGPLSLRFIVPSENAFKVAVANRIAEDLRTMGVAVELLELKWDAYMKALQGLDFDLYLAEVKLTSDFDLHMLLAEGGDLNFGRYRSEDMQLLLENFRSADTSRAKSAGQTLYRMILEEAPIVPILFKRGAVYAGRGHITSITPTQSNRMHGLNLGAG